MKKNPLKRHPLTRLWALILLTGLTACGGGGNSTTAATEISASQLTVNSLTQPAAVDSPLVSKTIDTALPGWRLVWSDEFETSGLPDATKWDFDTARNQTGWFNNELQYYARNRLENSRVEGGRLIITARRERLTTAADYGNQNYSSARLLTRDKASWTYGFFEVRAKLPCGQGTWPAIWMLGNGGSWPDDGEIDLMEQTGQNKAQVQATIHTRANNFFNGTLGPGLGSQLSLADACSAFHNYQLIWTADSLQLAVDSQNYFQYLNPHNNNYAQWPFDKPQFLLLNLAIGGDLGGPVEPQFIDQRLEIEYVRVYQR